MIAGIIVTSSSTRHCLADALAAAEIAKAEARDHDGAGDNQHDADLAPSCGLLLEHDHRYDRGVAQVDRPLHGGIMIGSSSSDA
jgi:hypothetical protein